MKKNLIPVCFITACMLSACGVSQLAANNKDLPVSSIKMPSPPPKPSGEDFEINEMTSVEVVDAIFLESFPLQVHVIVKGNLPDGCTTIQRHEVASEGKTFSIRLFTQREKGAVCTQALVPFEYIVPLDVYGLSAGTYRVEAYNASDEFTFSRDNIQQSTGGG